MEDKKKTIKWTKNDGIVISILLILLAVSVALYVFVPDPAQSAGDEKELGIRLNESGWEVYSWSTCKYCNSQKDVLGGAMEYINIIDCDLSDENLKLCSQANITQVPTWQNTITGERVLGYQTRDELEEMVKRAS